MCPDLDKCDRLVEMGVHGGEHTRRTPVVSSGVGCRLPTRQRTAPSMGTAVCHDPLRLVHRDLGPLYTRVWKWLLTIVSSVVSIVIFLEFLVTEFTLGVYVLASILAGAMCPYLTLFDQQNLRCRWASHAARGTELHGYGIQQKLFCS